MPAPRKPTVALVATGATKRNPGRHADRADEPQSGTLIGPAPAHLSAGAAACYTEIVALSHANVLTSADALIVEVAAVILHQFRTAPDAIPASRLARLDAILGRLGMDPSNRSKVKAVRPPASDKDSIEARFFTHPKAQQ